MTPGITRRLLLLLAPILGLALTAPGQALEKPNPIVFADVFIGPSLGIRGVLGGAELNYQRGHALFTARYVYAEDKDKIGEILLPLYEVQKSNNELAALYGWRTIQNVRSYSISLGPGYNSFRERVTEDGGERVTTTRYAGLSYEANIKWFKEQRAPFRILGLFPVGKPTAFGGSLGLKLAGNFSRHSYGGLALTYGLGNHKAY